MWTLGVELASERGLSVARRLHEPFEPRWLSRKHDRELARLDDMWRVHGVSFGTLMRCSVVLMTGPSAFESGSGGL